MTKKTSQKTPKFKVGDPVLMLRPNLYDETEGEVTEVVRSYKEVDENGKFIPRGLKTLETTISCIAVPYEFDGETLTIRRPGAEVMVSKFYGYSYTIKSKKILSSYPEQFLFKKSK